MFLCLGTVSGTIFTGNQLGVQQGMMGQQTQLVQQTSVPAQNQAQGQPTQATTVITADPNRQVPIHISLPGSDAVQRVLTIQVPASALQGNYSYSKSLLK